MQRYFIDKNDINEFKITITNQDVHHMKDVMRFKVNDKVIINTYDGLVYLANITTIDKKSVSLELIEEIESKYQPLPLDLGVSLIKKI
ncbi:MAG: RsmE family RNA methyltransferase, partial [Candidatus Izemoplasmatales bacterium]